MLVASIVLHNLQIINFFRSSCIFVKDCRTRWFSDFLLISVYSYSAIPNTLIYAKFRVKKWNYILHFGSTILNVQRPCTDSSWVTPKTHPKRILSQVGSKILNFLTPSTIFDFDPQFWARYLNFTNLSYQLFGTILYSKFESEISNSGLGCFFSRIFWLQDSIFLGFPATISSSHFEIFEID